MVAVGSTLDVSGRQRAEKLGDIVSSQRWRLTALALLIPGLVGIAAGSSPAQAQVDEPVESYVVVMAADPAVAYEGAEPGLAPTKPGEGDKLDPAATAVEEYVEFLEADQDAALSRAGVAADAVVQNYTYAISGFEVSATSTQVKALEGQPGVASVVPNEFRQLQTDASASFLGLDDPGGAYEAGYTGEDVVVGVIDSGIWPEHGSFADDGSYSELADYADLPCDFGDTEYNADDAPFECNNKVLGARDMRDGYKNAIGPETFNSARDYDGHGTHTAATAAGNEGVAADIFGVDFGAVSGVAPRARVIAYSACGDQGCVLSDLLGSIDQSVADGVDVINYSIGSATGSLTSPDDMAFLFAADANVWVATSAGNSGPGPDTIGSPASVPWVTTVGASTQARTFSAFARFGNGQVATGASVTGATDGAVQLVDAADLGNELCDPAVEFTADITGKAVLCLRGEFARVDKSLAVAEQGGAAMVLYNPNDAQALVTDLHFVPSVHVNFSTGSIVKLYIEVFGEAATVQLTEGAVVPAQGSTMADFSSRGANTIAPDLIKPDVTAPGVNILAGHTPFPSSGAPGQLFQSISGTSMSSPHVAGVFALMRQANPDWTAAMAKSAIMTTARQDVTKEDGSTPADPFDMGAGHIDPSGAVDAANSVFNPGLVYDVGLSDYFAFLCGADDSVFFDPVGTCGAYEAAGVSTDATALNLASIGASQVAGVVTVERTVTSVADETLDFSAEVSAPAGFDVIVTPSVLTLAPGESATFDVTMTSTTATPGQWAFGSLTWAGGGYSVYSPIAVRGLAFAGPQTVVGSGVDGSVDVPVTFGFDGPYAVGRHGAAQQISLSGTVGQDPDQSFDPADTVGNVAFEVTTSSTAFVRFALTDADLAVSNTNVDLDVYLFDSAGNLAASSGAGGTSELIDILIPPDDTWTLFVHGWNTDGGDVDFTLRAYDVPDLSGTPTLEVDGVPGSVAVGQQETLVASWSDLEADSSYLGALSHFNLGGLIGVTLVEINT